MSITVVHFFLTSMNIIGSGSFCSRSENLVCSTCIRNFCSVSLWYLNWLPSEEYVLIDKMGGPNGKVLGSFFYDERTRRSLVLVSWTRAKYFLIRPDSTHSISVLSCDPCKFLFLFYFLESHLVGPYGFFQNCSRHCVLPDKILGFISEVFQWKNALILVHVPVTKKMPLEIIRS